MKSTLLITALLLVSSSSFAEVCGVKLTSMKGGEISFQELYLQEGANDFRACKKALKVCNQAGKSREKAFSEIYMCEGVYHAAVVDADAIAKIYAEFKPVSTVAATKAMPAPAYVTCTDARDRLRDAGYGLTITKEGEVLQANISAQSIAGPRDLGTVTVKENNRGMSKIYTGKDFKLSIALESMRAGAKHPAKFSFRQRKIKNAQLTCRFAD